MANVVASDSRLIAGSPAAVAASVDRLIDRYEAQTRMASRLTGNPPMLREAPTPSSRTMTVKVPGIVSGTTRFSWAAEGANTRLTVSLEQDLSARFGVLGSLMTDPMNAEARRVLNEVAAGVEPDVSGPTDIAL